MGREMKGTKIRSIFWWMLLVMACAGLFTAQVWKQNQYVRLTRNQAAAKARLQKVRSDIANIQLDNKKLKDYKKLEKMGEKHFGFVHAGLPELIFR